MLLSHKKELEVRLFFHLQSSLISCPYVKETLKCLVQEHTLGSFQKRVNLCAYFLKIGVGREWLDICTYSIVLLEAYP